MISDPKEAMKQKSQEIEAALNKQFPDFEFHCTVSAAPRYQNTIKVRGGVTVPLAKRGQGVDGNQSNG